MFGRHDSPAAAHRLSEVSPNNHISLPAEASDRPARYFFAHTLFLIQRTRAMIAVLFEAHARPEHQMRYLQLAADLSPLLKEIDGFLSIERFQSLSDEKKILSLSWWRDDDAVQAWKRNLCHQAAQREGRETLFAGYRIRITTLVREYASQQGVN